MDFIEYISLKHRCEIYKMNAIKTICKKVGNFSWEDSIPGQSYFEQLSDETFSYHIHFCDGFNLEGSMAITELNDAINEGEST